jgi:predicted DNA-binding transcriptional regulator
MDDSHPEPRVAPEDVAIESAVLELLVGEGARHWSVEEIAREIGSELKVLDAVAGLYRAGLAHQTSDGFVFATRAAIRASELQM